MKQGNKMTANDATYGQMYQLENKAWRPTCIAECYGLNATKDSMLFLFFDERNKRKILAIPLKETVIPK